MLITLSASGILQICLKCVEILLFWVGHNPLCLCCCLQNRCDHMMQSPSGCITDIFSLSSPSNDLKSDRNIVKSMRSPHIHNPQAVEAEFATCSDKGTISLWNLKMQKSHSRQHTLISPASHRPGNTIFLTLLLLIRCLSQVLQ